MTLAVMRIGHSTPSPISNIGPHQICVPSPAQCDSETEIDQRGCCAVLFMQRVLLNYPQPIPRISVPCRAETTVLQYSLQANTNCPTVAFIVSAINVPQKSIVRYLKKTPRDRPLHKDHTISSPPPPFLRRTCARHIHPLSTPATDDSTIDAVVHCNPKPTSSSNDGGNSTSLANHPSIP